MSALVLGLVARVVGGVLDAVGTDQQQSRLSGSNGGLGHLQLGERHLVDCVRSRLNFGRRTMKSLNQHFALQTNSAATCRDSLIHLVEFVDETSLDLSA